MLEILKERGATRVVKGKSMVSEEMHLNDFLEERGIESLESDLGEYIIQLDGETPSHIIMPAIHKNKQQIAKLFGKKIREAKYTEDVDELTAIARRVLRRKFFEADAGISGVNFAVAETGTLCLVENEGNGRMSTHVPPVHIALMGIEKVVERLEDVPPLYTPADPLGHGPDDLDVLQHDHGPARPGEKDGPAEVHLVILDNGRSRIFSDVELSATLRCIRCGACMNHCPVYTRVGGHAYEAVYPGPIGKILTPQTEGVARRHDLLHASSLCGACVEACPVEIPIAELLVRLRREATHKEPGSTVLEAGEGTRPARGHGLGPLGSGSPESGPLSPDGIRGDATAAFSPVVAAGSLRMDERSRDAPSRRADASRARQEGRCGRCLSRILAGDLSVPRTPWRGRGFSDGSAGAPAASRRLPISP